MDGQKLRNHSEYRGKQNRVNLQVAGILAMLMLAKTIQTHVRRHAADFKEPIALSTARAAAKIWQQHSPRGRV